MRLRQARRPLPAHLRQLAADLHARLDLAEAEAARASDLSEFWRENAMQLQQTLHEECFTVGITKEGQMLAFKTAIATNQVAPS